MEWRSIRAIVAARILRAQPDVEVSGAYCLPQRAPVQ
jgi:hypothetical protein